MENILKTALYHALRSPAQVYSLALRLHCPGAYTDSPSLCAMGSAISLAPDRNSGVAVTGISCNQPSRPYQTENTHTTGRHSDGPVGR